MQRVSWDIHDIISKCIEYVPSFNNIKFYEWICLVFKHRMYELIGLLDTRFMNICRISTYKNSRIYQFTLSL